VILSDAALRLEAAGAECLVICTNTMHLMADEIQSRIGIPIIHIADATAALIKEAEISCVGLLGTRFTMEKDFYKGRLETLHGLKVIVPDELDRNEVHRIIYEELCVGKIREESRDLYKRVFKKFQNSGVRGIILGCTEIELLIQQADSPLPIFSTAKIHAESAVRWSLSVAT
jgi:aspartate racemase